MLDYLIKDGDYPDYKTNKIVQGNIGIKGKYIVYLGMLEPAAKETIDASGMIVSPGFIDIHMHEEDFLKEGKHYDISNHMLEMGVTTACGGNCGHSRQPLRIFKHIVRELGGVPINYCMQSGYNNLRVDDGIGPFEKTTEKMREKYIRVLNEEIKEGSYGVSFGIEYDPGITFEEMIFISRVSDNPDHLFSAHYRSDTTKNLDSVKEMIRFSKEIKPRFQISHLSSCAAFSNMKDALYLIDKAMERDPGLNFDTYPYNAFSCTLGSTVFDEGFLDDWGKGYEDVLLLGEPYKNIRCTEEIFRKARKDYPGMLAVAFAMEEEDIRLAVKHKSGMIASDGLLRDGNGHPRAAGTFPRVLGRYVRDAKLMPMIDALRKMTLEPAERLRLFNKGRIEEGCDADITVFDPEAIMDRADFSYLEKPDGIKHIFIWGEPAMIEGEVINRRLGKFIPFS